MVARSFTQFQQALEKNAVSLFANVSIGATGACTLNNIVAGSGAANKSQGIQSIVRNSTGNYTVTFGDPNQLGYKELYARLIMADVAILFGTVTGVTYQVWADNSTSGNVILQFVGPTAAGNTAPVATDPPNGAVLLINFVLKNGSV